MFFGGEIGESDWARNCKGKFGISFSQAFVFVHENNKCAFDSRLIISKINTNLTYCVNHKSRIYNQRYVKKHLIGHGSKKCRFIKTEVFAWSDWWARRLLIADTSKSCRIYEMWLEIWLTAPDVRHEHLWFEEEKKRERQKRSNKTNN